MPQVYLLDLAGGEPRKLTDVAMGVQDPLVFSPDGKKLAFVSDVFPECADEACNRRRHEEAEKSPVKVHHLTRLMYRHWDEWRENVRHHVLLADVGTGAVTDLTPGDFDSPPHLYEEAGIAFSPDGKEIAFVSNRDGNDREAFTTNKDVFLVPVAGGAAEKLTVAERRGGLQSRLHARRRVDPRARAAAADVRGGPLVPRRLRPEDEGEADALREPGPVRERIRPV